MTLGSLLHSDDRAILVAEHTSLDIRLKELGKRKSHTPEERYEMQVIKKRKLALKDRIHRME